MTQPSIIAGRPQMPPPGAQAQELLIARFRSHSRRLLFSAVILIGAAFAVTYFTNNLPKPFENWMLWTAAGVVVFLLVLVPYLRWLTRRYSITTRRVVVSSGFLSQRRVELTHARGYTMTLTRGPLQRMWGAGTLTLSNGADRPVELRNIPNARLVHEVLVDQVEINQILAHRDAAAFPQY